MIVKVLQCRHYRYLYSSEYELLHISPLGSRKARNNKIFQIKCKFFWVWEYQSSPRRDIVGSQVCVVSWKLRYGSFYDQPNDIHMKCPKVGCLHWIPRGCLYIGVHGGFTRVVVKRPGNKMTRLTPLLSRDPGETGELSTERRKILAGSQCKEASEWKEINFLIYSTIIGGAEINNRILQSFSIKHLQHFLLGICPVHA